MHVNADITTEDLIAGFVQLRRSIAKPSKSRADYRPLILTISFATMTLPVTAAAITGTFLFFDPILRIALLGASIGLAFVTIGMTKAILKDRHKPDPIEASASRLRREIETGLAIPDIGPHSITLTDEGVQSVSPNATWLLHWRMFHSIHDLPDYIALCRASGTCIPIPKRAFASPDGAAAFYKEALCLHAAVSRMPPTSRPQAHAPPP